MNDKTDGAQNAGDGAQADSTTSRKWHWPDWAALLETSRRVAFNIITIAAIAVSVPVFVKLVTFRGVVIDDIAVPTAVSDRGLTSDVISRRIRDRLHEMNVDAKAKKEQAAVTGSSIESQLPDIQLPGGWINLSSAISQIRHFLGYVDTKISGEIIVEPAGDDKRNAPTYSLRLRMPGYGVLYRSVNPSASIDALIDAAAIEVMHRFDPINLGYYLYRNKDYANAYRMTETALANDSPDDEGWAFNMRGLILREQRQCPEAISQFRIAIRRAPKFAVAYYHLAETLRLTGDLEGAAAVAAQSIELAPKNLRGHANLALVYLDQGKTADALDLLQKAVQADPRNAQGHFDLGVLLRKLNRLDDAAAAFGRAAEIQPDFFYAYTNLSTMLYLAGKYDEARAKAQEAADTSPNSAVPWNLLGLYALEHNDYPGAVTHFRKATTLDKAFVEGHINLGIALTKEKKFADATAAFQKAAQLHPRDASVLMRWADALEAQGRRSQALDKRRQANAIAPKQTNLYGPPDRLHEAMGNVACAIVSDNKPTDGACAPGLGPTPCR